MKRMLVRFIEWITGHSSRSNEDIKALLSENAKLKNLERECRDKIKELNESVRKLTDEKKELSSKITSLEEQLASQPSVSSDSQSSVSSDFRNMVDSLILCIQNSEILHLDDSFDKNDTYNYFVGQIGQILSLLGIEEFEDEGIPVNPSFHQIVSSVKSDDESKVGLISRSLRKGYRKGNECVVEQKVEVYK